MFVDISDVEVLLGFDGFSGVLNEMRKNIAVTGAKVQVRWVCPIAGIS